MSILNSNKRLTIFKKNLKKEVKKMSNTKNLMEKISNVTIDSNEVTVKSQSIVLNTLKAGFLSSIRVKSNLNHYFLFEGYLFIAINKPSLKDLSDIQKKEKKLIYKTQIENFEKCKKSALILKKVTISDFTNITDKQDLIDFGIADYKELTIDESKALKEIEVFTHKFNKLVNETDIKKTIDLLKVL